uniref:Uncharacterized protein n=1 Tax=Anguilla anguilla TaxID=7936 RepID=A0A0E9PV38_ANGAN
MSPYWNYWPQSALARSRFDPRPFSSVYHPATQQEYCKFLQQSHEPSSFKL